jgi:DNA-binding IclR family transcriptional regulator
LAIQTLIILLMYMQGTPESGVRSDARGIQSVEAGYQLLELLANAPGPMSLTALALGAGMATSRAHLYLTSFLRLGLVSRATPGGAYALGPAALRLGLAAITQLDVLQIARDAMFELRDSTGGPVFLSVWGNRGPTVIHRVEGMYWIPGEVRVGTVFPILSASGLAFMTAFPEQHVRSLVEAALRETPSHDPWHDLAVDDVVKLVAEVRHDGYARGRGVVARGSGLVGLTAPIVDHEGVVTAALTINSTPQGKPAADAAAVDALLATSRRVSWEIGHRTTPQAIRTSGREVV